MNFYHIKLFLSMISNFHLTKITYLQPYYTLSTKNNFNFSYMHFDFNSNH